MFQRFLVLVVFALALIHIAQAATLSEFVPENPVHPGKCWLKQQQIAIGVGERFQIPNGCRTRNCARNPKGGYIVADFTCGIIIRNGVRVHPNFSKPYPACCNA